MSASQDIIVRLHAEGMSYKAIGELIGRNDSLVGQIARGLKPGNNLTASLEAVERNRHGGNVAVPAPERRKNAKGQEAQVRRPTGKGRTVVVRSPGTIKKGAKSVHNRLVRAAADGQMTAWTVVFPVGTQVGKYPGKVGHHANAQLANAADFGNIPAADMEALVLAHGGNVGAALVAHLVAENRLDNASVMPISIEMRTYLPRE